MVGSQVEEDRQGGEQRRAEDRDQHHEGDQDDGADHERQPGLGRRAVVVEDCGAAAHARHQVAFAGQPRGFGVEDSAGGPGAGGVEGIG